MESFDLDVAGEFLVMAATLVEIKSKMLLPPDPKEESESEEPVDPRLELVERLIEYQRYKGAAELLRGREQERQKLFLRGMTEIEQLYDRPAFVLKDITAVDLLTVLNRMLADVSGGDEVEVTSIQKRKISLRMRMSEVWRKINIAAGQLVLFEDLFVDQKTKSDIVITFLALLELLRLGRVGVKQERVFGNIEVFCREEALTGYGNNG
jgi:segregation and condensation protein A